jgi:hypothetical protein
MKDVITHEGYKAQQYEQVDGSWFAAPRRRQIIDWGKGREKLMLL